MDTKSFHSIWCFPWCPSCPLWLFSAPNIHSVESPMLIVARGKVRPEVAPATLFAAERGTRDEPGNRDQAEASPGLAVRGGGSHAGFSGHIGLREACDRMAQAVSAAKQADRAPHQVSHGGDVIVVIFVTFFPGDHTVR